MANHIGVLQGLAGVTNAIWILKPKHSTIVCSNVCLTATVCRWPSQCIFHKVIWGLRSGKRHTTWWHVHRKWIAILEWHNYALTCHASYTFRVIKTAHLTVHTRTRNKIGRKQKNTDRFESLVVLLGMFAESHRTEKWNDSHTLWNELPPYLPR